MSPGWKRISRGEVGLIVAQIGREKGILDQAAYAVMVVVVLVSTVITPILLRLSFPRVRETESDVYESVVCLEEESDEIA